MDFLKQNPDNLSHFLGFRVPGEKFENLMELIEKNSQMKEDVENHAFFKEEEFENNITKYHKHHHNDKKVKVEKTNKTIYVDAVNINELGPVEKAFFLGFDPDRIVQSDIEANKIKMLSPSLVTKPSAGAKDETKMENDSVSVLNLEGGKIIPEDGVEETKETTICVCKEVTITDVDLCICCETCNRWYHHICFGLGNTSEEDLKKMIWNCPECESKPKNSEKKQQKKPRRGIK